MQTLATRTAVPQRSANTERLFGTADATTMPLRSKDSPHALMQCNCCLQGESAVRFRHILRCLRPTSPDVLSSEVLVDFAMAAHHPRVQTKPDPRLWQAVTQQISAAIPSILAGELSLKPAVLYELYVAYAGIASFCIGSLTIMACFAGHASGVAATLLSDDGMSSSSAAQRLAAERALGSLMAADPEALYTAVMELASPLLEREAHDAVCFVHFSSVQQCNVPSAALLSGAFGGHYIAETPLMTSGVAS